MLMPVPTRTPGDASPRVKVQRPARACGVTTHANADVVTRSRPAATTAPRTGPGTTLSSVARTSRRTTTASTAVTSASPDVATLHHSMPASNCDANGTSWTSPTDSRAVNAAT